jgi:hypothetical protein
MKAFFISIVFPVAMTLRALAGDGDTNEWGSVTNNVQMGISVSGNPDEIKTNQPVRLLIRLKNDSTNEAVGVMRTEPEYDLSLTFNVTSPTGKDISPRARYAPVSASSFQLLPQQTTSEEYNISDFCKFDEIGTYVIVVKQALSEPATKKPYVVISNPLYLDVTPGRWTGTIRNSSDIFNFPR